MLKLSALSRRAMLAAAIAGVIAMPLAEAKADCWYDWSTVQVGPNGNGLWMKRYCAHGAYTAHSMGWFQFQAFWY